MRRGAARSGATCLLALAAAAAGSAWAAPPPPAPALAAPESVGLSSARLQRLDNWLNAEIAARRKAGAVVLIARHGRVAWRKAYGHADIAAGTPMRSDAMFRLFSMGKPITSVALLTLYERGKFQLTDPLEKYLPAFKDVKVYAGVDAAGKAILRAPKRPPTIQDVFRHTAGFVYGYFDDTPVDRAYRAAGVDYRKVDSLAQLVDRIASQPLLYDPGERWVYSFAHDVQAYLVEYFSGMPFDEYCRRTIFEPLGMKDTVFGIPPEREARYPTAYHADASGTLIPYTAQDDFYRQYRHPFGGVSLASTAQDYFRFAQMLLRGGELDGVRILGRKTVELMSSDNLPPETAYWTPGVRYGLGVFVVTDPAQNGVLGSKGEFGWPGLASSWVSIDPHEDLVALVMVQSVPRDLHFDDEFQTLVYQALVN